MNHAAAASPDQSMTVADLDGATLDYWVAHANGDRVKLQEGRCLRAETDAEHGDGAGWFPYSPSSDWAHGGPIIERDQIYLEPPHDVHALNYGPDGKPRGCWQTYESWHATVSARTRTYPNPASAVLPGCVGRGEGPTALVAAMRAKVASHYGDYVPAAGTPE